MILNDVLGFLITIALIVAVMALEAFFLRWEERNERRKAKAEKQVPDEKAADESNDGERSHGQRRRRG